MYKVEISTVGENLFAWSVSSPSDMAVAKSTKPSPLNVCIQQVNSFLRDNRGDLYMQPICSEQVWHERKQQPVLSDLGLRTRIIQSGDQWFWQYETFQDEVIAVSANGFDTESECYDNLIIAEGANKRVPSLELMWN